MRAATIDIGTNSVLLLVAEKQPSGTIRTVFETMEICRLGAGVDAQGRLQAAAIERTLAVLQRYAQRLEGLGVQRRAAVGTSALRDALNGAELTEPARETLGCPIQVVSGDREAALVRRGVGSSFERLGEADVIFDVGGGSTEFVVSSDPPRLVSLDVGTVRLTERHLVSDPPSPAELTAARRTVEQQLRALEAFFPPHIERLIGVAGTVTTLVTIELALQRYDSQRVNGAQLNREQVRQLEQRLAGLELAQRQRLPGLHPKRADVIVTGATLVGTVMDHLGVENLHVCDRGVRWGLLLELLQS